MAIKDRIGSRDKEEEKPVKKEEPEQVILSMILPIPIGCDYGRPRGGRYRLSSILFISIADSL